ncbi:hypothetical protein [Brevibacillus reuszeri]|nr:hypothetical protein [Brevibacillus reuszeri]
MTLFQYHWIDGFLEIVTLNGPIIALTKNLAKLLQDFLFIYWLSPPG